MNLKQIFKHYWVILLAVIALTFWLGFFITEEFVNRNACYYSITFNSSEIRKEDIDSNFFLDALRKVDENGNISYSYETVKPESFFSNSDIITIEDNGLFTINIKAHYFIGSDENSISNKSQERFYKVMRKVILFHDKNSIINNEEIIDYTNPFVVGIYSLVGGFLVFLIVMFFIRKKLPVPNEEIYECGNIYKWPFSKKYWTDAINSIKKLKIFDMCMISILFALQIVLKFVSIPTGFPGLNIVINYLIFALIALIYGPIWGMVIGFGSDIIGFVMNPVMFHFGYTIQAILTGFVYGICLYKTDLKFSKVLVCRIIINILLNGVFGSFLWGDYNGWSLDATILYMWAVSLPKNILYLIPQVILLYVFLRAAVILPIRKGMIPKETLKIDKTA